tara:strand:+ start:4879 stop:5661 length:783 start_codon:yes stop_codon:yes gene_type:complete
MSPLKTEIQGKVATLTLNRPEQMNTIDLGMAKALYEASLSFTKHSTVRALIITGAGEKAFCAGGDLAAFNQHGEAIGEHLHEVTHYLHGAISRFARMTLPVIAAVNGVTAGGGLAFLGFPQLVLAADSARFVSAYTKAGLSPDGSSTWYLPRLIGVRRAQEFVFMNRMLKAEEAVEWGLVNKTVKASDLMDEAGSAAEMLAAGPRAAYGRIKELFNSSLTTPLETQMENEARYLALSAQSPDGQAGIKAFLTKTVPHFTE